MTSKKKSVNSHFERRCFQRLGYIPRKKELVEAIQKQKLAFVERQSNRVTKWLWKDPIHGIECILPYDKDRKQIITVLFKDMEDERKNIKIEENNELV